MGVKPNRSAWLKNHSKTETSGPPKENETVAKPVVASDLLKEKHPLHKTFKAWCVENGKEESKRQAAVFLRQHPEYRTATPA